MQCVQTTEMPNALIINAPLTPEQKAQVEAEADLFYTDFVERADERRRTVDAVDADDRDRYGPISTTSDELKIAREEIFGPVLVASPYDSLEEVAARANEGEYGLAAGVWTRTSRARTSWPRCCAPARST